MIGLYIKVTFNGFFTNRVEHYKDSKIHISTNGVLCIQDIRGNNIQAFAHGEWKKAEEVYYPFCN